MLRLFVKKYSKIVKYYYNVKSMFSMQAYIKYNLFLWSKLYFQHNYSSLQCHMIFINHSDMLLKKHFWLLWMLDKVGLCQIQIQSWQIFFSSFLCWSTSSGFAVIFSDWSFWMWLFQVVLCHWFLTLVNPRSTPANTHSCSDTDAMNMYDELQQTMKLQCALAMKAGRLD